MDKRRNREQRPKGPPSRLMSQSAAARALRMSRVAVMARVAAGELQVEMVDQTPVLVRASVDAYAARRERRSSLTQASAA